MTNIFNITKAGDRGDWKPVQTGVIMVMKSVLGVHEELLNDGHKIFTNFKTNITLLGKPFNLCEIEEYGSISSGIHICTKDY